MARIISILVALLFLVFSAVGIAQKQRNACLYTIDEIFWGFPDDYLTIRVFNDKVRFDYAKNAEGHELTAPIMLSNEVLNIKVDNDLFSLDEKSGPSNVVSVRYEKNYHCDRVGGTIITPVLLCIQKGDNPIRAYLLDPLGNKVHHSLVAKESDFQDCYKGIPDGWIKVVDLVCQVRLSIMKNPVMEMDKGGANKETRMINSKFSEYYGPGGPGARQYKDERTVTDTGASGVVDAGFLSFVYNDKKITGVSFDDIAAILKRRNNILKKAMPLIKWDEYNGILTSNDNFPELMKTPQYGSSFKEIEKLVGLADE